MDVIAVVSTSSSTTTSGYTADYARQLLHSTASSYLQIKISNTLTDVERLREQLFSFKIQHYNNMKGLFRYLTIDIVWHRPMLAILQLYVIGNYRPHGVCLVLNEVCFWCILRSIMSGNGI